MRLTALALALLVAAPAAAAEHATFNPGTARTLPEGRWEIGVFAPLRYGVTDRIELRTHPIADFLIPNLEVQVALDAPEGRSVALTGGLAIPTLLLRTLAKEGIGGMLAPAPPYEVDGVAGLPDWTVVPLIVAPEVHLLYSAELTGSHLATVRLGGKVGIPFGPMHLGTIDHPFGYARTAAFSKGFTLDAGLSFDGTLAGPLSYRLDLDAFFIPVRKGTWALEHSGSLRWAVSEGFAMMVGYKLYAGELPYGTDFFPPVPLIDLYWAW